MRVESTSHFLPRAAGLEALHSGYRPDSPVVIGDEDLAVLEYQMESSNKKKKGKCMCACGAGYWAQQLD
ncbi:MAG: hypothetical protein MUF66_01695 [Gammaproteobacteria bacterium]|jgi:hypothetical protein|nr:hypothetical protein [Gammaproteobacteria bacterium]